jgi:hypothetical protein
LDAASYLPSDVIHWPRFSGDVEEEVEEVVAAAAAAWTAA